MLKTLDGVRTADWVNGSFVVEAVNSNSNSNSNSDNNSKGSINSNSRGETLKRKPTVDLEPDRRDGRGRLCDGPVCSWPRLEAVDVRYTIITIMYYNVI